MRELYRDLVRQSPSGEEANSGNLFGTLNRLFQDLTQLILSADSASALHWLPVLLLADLYSQALLTMWDNEFFDSSTSSSRAGHRRHLTSWCGSASGCSILHLLCTGAMPSRLCTRVCFAPGEVFTGDGKREGGKVFVGYPRKSVSSIRLFSSNSCAHGGVKFTQTIFTWLVTSHLDMNSFVEAAAYVPRFKFSVTVPLNTADSVSNHNSFRNPAHTTQVSSASAKQPQCQSTLGSSILSPSPFRSKSASQSSSILS